MRVLLIKTSSMGDVLHALAAVEDAAVAIPGIQFDWVVEENFAEIPAWHGAVRQVIPVALRRWRKHPQSLLKGELFACIRQLRSGSYDLVIDAQGLLKSAAWTMLARGKKHGFDWSSCREPIASLFYQKKWAVPQGMHAVTRLRALMAQVLGYEQPQQLPEYGIKRERLPVLDLPSSQVVFLHGTTWETKHWPVEHWIELGRRVQALGLQILLPWGSPAEQVRAQTICAALTNALVLPRLTLIEAASVLAHARAVVAVDTGLGHLAAALGVSTISIYGPTDPQRTGAYGLAQHHIQSKLDCAPCLDRICKVATTELFPPCFNQDTLERTWQQLKENLECS